MISPRPGVAALVIPFPKNYHIYNILIFMDKYRGQYQGKDVGVETGSAKNY
jgi:hypothetical protein